MCVFKKVRYITLYIPFLFSANVVIAQATAKADTMAAAAIYPNPARYKIEIAVKNFEAGVVQLMIADINGKLFRNDYRLLINGNENMIVMFALPAGVYFVQLRQQKKIVKKKLVVE
jgi:hypothetical protein